MGKHKESRYMWLVSVFLLQLSLWNPVYFFWCAFIWLIPLFYGALIPMGRLSWKEGFLWGSLFFTLHLVPVIIFFTQQAQGPCRYIFPLLLIMYCAMHTALWFWAATITARWWGDGMYVRVCSWCAWTIFFWAWVPHGLLWISGHYIGYPLVFPVLAMAQYPQLIWPVQYVGLIGLLALQVMVAMCVTLVMLKFSWAALFFLVLGLGLFCAGPVVQRLPRAMPACCKKFGYVRPPRLSEGEYPLDAAQKIYYSMRVVLESHPEITHLFMPELTYRYALNTTNYVIGMWNNNVLHDKVTLFIGACREEAGKFYNSVYMIERGAITAWYDKSRLMPFVEYMPQWYKRMPFLNKLFLHDNEFCARVDRGTMFKVTSTCIMEPYVCAELFFGKVSCANNVSDNAYVLSILNDVALSKSMQKLMMFWSVLKAVEWQRICLYVGYDNAVVIMPDGNRHAIS
jgi:apolipoprotein N-acyltransferase